jgi:hypothetical protein
VSALRASARGASHATPGDSSKPVASDRGASEHHGRPASAVSAMHGEVLRSMLVPATTQQKNVQQHATTQQQAA